MGAAKEISGVELTVGGEGMSAVVESPGALVKVLLLGATSLTVIAAVGWAKVILPPLLVVLDSSQ